MQSLHNDSTIIALDVGERRIGVAIASIQAQIASPLATLLHTETIYQDIHDVLDKHTACALIVGLPRGLDGQHTRQTIAIEEFKAGLEQTLGIPVYWQDEALTSRQAEDELKSRGKPYAKEDIDALSATYILDDFMRDHPEVFL